MQQAQLEHRNLYTNPRSVPSSLAPVASSTHQCRFRSGSSSSRSCLTEGSSRSQLTEAAAEYLSDRPPAEPHGSSTPHDHPATPAAAVVVRVGSSDGSSNNIRSSSLSTSYLKSPCCKQPFPGSAVMYDVQHAARSVKTAAADMAAAVCVS
jgi:hypothetical protein